MDPSCGGQSCRGADRRPRFGKDHAWARTHSGFGVTLPCPGAIKERLYESSDGALVGIDLRLATESELSAQLSASHGPAVVDIWVQPGRDTARVARLLARSSPRIVEVRCRVPAEVAVDRYRRRVRNGPHKPADEETLQRIRDAAAAFLPLGVGPCIEVDTSAPVPVEALLALLP